MGKGTHALSIVCFLLGLWPLGAMMHRVAPVPELEQVSDKIRMYERGAGRYSALIFGSSKIYTGFIPQVCDEALQQAGVPVQTLNFGVDSMSFPESAYLCEYLLKKYPFKPKWIFVEATPVHWRIPPWQRGSRRILYWHDLKRTAQLERTLAEEMGSWKEFTSPAYTQFNAIPADLCLEHLSLGARRALCVGQGAGWLAKVMPSAEENPARFVPRDHPEPALAGYFPIKTTLPEKAMKEYQESLATFGKPVSGAGGKGAQRAYQDLEATARAAGAKLVMVVFPNPAPSRHMSIFSDKAHPPIWAFDDVAKYPELYRPENRESSVHLNDRGAHLFSGIFASRFAEWLRGEKEAGVAAAP